MSIPAAQQPVYLDAVRIDVSRWSGNWVSRLAEVSTSGTTGTRYAPVRPDPSWQVDLPNDDAAFVEALGWVPGQVIAAMTFKHSALSGDIVTVTTVESVQKVSDNNNDVVRVVVTGKGGNIAYNQPIL